MNSLEIRMPMPKLDSCGLLHSQVLERGYLHNAYWSLRHCKKSYVLCKFTCWPRVFCWSLADSFPVKLKKPVTERQEQVEINVSFLLVKENVISERKVSAHSGCRTRASAAMQFVLFGFILVTVALSVCASAGPQHPAQARVFILCHLFPVASCGFSPSPSSASHARKI